ncbi:MAG: hypothetical protein GF398_06215 [Chitinivibrionales bacterium]|nr:hypothetical protein [Chitinivibrionales bacterium]
MSREKRRSPRVYMTIALTLQINGELIRNARCCNLSSGGMYIAVDNLPEPGTAGTISLTKKCDDSLISFTAGILVRWQRQEIPVGIGAEFVNIDPANQQNLQRILSFQQSVASVE